MALGDEEPMGDAPPLIPVPTSPPAASIAPMSSPGAKPRRRFAPQLVEQSAKTSSGNRTQQLAQSNKLSALTPPISTTNSTRRPTRDVSVQVDVDMTDAPPPPLSKPARRFAPVPIETTFDSYRVSNNRKYPIGPAAELTPDPSPTSPQAPPLFENEKQNEEPQKPRRKFAPQLIETTRRSKKANQPGPATRPVDKTDITPGTNHIYAPKPKRKPGPRTSAAGPAQATSDNDGFLTPRRQQSMKPHPNTRRSTRHSYAPELDTILSSESEKSVDDEGEEEEAPGLCIGTPALSIGTPTLSIGAPDPDDNDDEGNSWNSRKYHSRDRRESCDEEFSGYLLAVAAREAHRQRELEAAMAAFPNGVRPQGVEHFVVRDNSEDDDPYDERLRHGTSRLLRRKESEPGWAVKEMRAHAEKLARVRQDEVIVDDELDHMDIAPPPEDPLWTTTTFRTSLDETMRDAPSPNLSASSPALLARMDSHPRGQDRPFTPSPRLGPETGLRASPFGIPFGIRSGEPEDPQMRKMRMAAAPPMLGGDLEFRLCPSPKHTRMEPSQRYCAADKPEEPRRDVTGGSGLWRGYCSAKTNCTVENAQPGPNLLMTPKEPNFPADPFSAAFTASMSISGVMTATQSSGTTSPTNRHSLSKGLYILSGLDERLKKEKARKELEERIAAEFDDSFVTQVYNYISLGYPTTARAFDEELSKISGIDIEELRKDDNLKVEKGFMLHMEMSIHRDRSSSDSDFSEDTQLRTPEEDERRARRRRQPKPPRWIALKLYIREWARQHPDLNDSGTAEMAWGVRARRGSWAI
ncbi:hypothetical protein GGS23DRAFT_482364 [Durotheca rogersii]|uniref:uncharacterized protein n=1 Tax=Durotheca rogersii TaxID=419775 RepID=UPI00221EA7CF|nr:uncharacterized protein GGS23DRAFT_482364 [Durotheca rogersii]KAI5864096.1 hypothetical protein GGS23DRAFT_482364 [Durotheca rogersii]